MNSAFFQGHQLRLVFFFMAWLCCLGASGQAGERALFPQMPWYNSFPPQLIKGALPEASSLQVTRSQVEIGRKPLPRNGKAYWKLNIYYDNVVSTSFYLRQRADTVFMAMDAWDENWNAGEAASSLAGFRQTVQQLPAYPGRRPVTPPANLEESVFLRFNAQAGDQWTCFARTHGGIGFYQVQLERIIPPRQGEVLYVFDISPSLRGSHMPQLLKLVVSRSGGVRGMLWYDYACWKPYDCEDLLVRYGDWE